MRDTITSLSRFGDDLLSHALRRSTIGATHLTAEFGMGSGVLLGAMITKPRNYDAFQQIVFQVKSVMLFVYASCELIGVSAFTGSNQAYRAISTGQLNALLRFHISAYRRGGLPRLSGRPCFEGGFPLRCFQRLSCPIHSYPALPLAPQQVHQWYRSPRSSRTRGNSSQVSYTHGR